MANRKNLHSEKLQLFGNDEIVLFTSVLPAIFGIPFQFKLLISHLIIKLSVKTN